MGFFSSLFKKKELSNVSRNEKRSILMVSPGTGRLSQEITDFTSNQQQKLSLAKQLLTRAKVDFRHEYYFPNKIKKDMREDIDFSKYSSKLLELYNQAEAEAEAHKKLLSTMSPEDYDPMAYRDKNLDGLDMFTVGGIFDAMVRTIDNPKERFLAKLYIVDDMLQ